MTEAELNAHAANLQHMRLKLVAQFKECASESTAEHEQLRQILQRIEAVEKLEAEVKTRQRVLLRKGGGA